MHESSKAKNLVSLISTASTSHCITTYMTPTLSIRSGKVEGSEEIQFNIKVLIATIHDFFLDREC